MARNKVIVDEASLGNKFQILAIHGYISSQKHFHSGSQMEVVYEQRTSRLFIAQTLLTLEKTTTTKSNYCISKRVMTMLDTRVTNFASSSFNQKLDRRDYGCAWKIRGKTTLSELEHKRTIKLLPLFPRTIKFHFGEDIKVIREILK